jgi:cell division protein FtsB
MLNKWRKFFTPERIIFFVFLFYLLFLLGQGIIQRRNLEAEKTELEKRVARQEVMKMYYSRLKGLLGREAYLEKMARTKLQMVQNGESAYKVFMTDNKGGRK